MLCNQEANSVRYLLQHRSETHIDPFQAAFDLLTTCTTYLSHNAINETSNDDILRNIAKGKYRFAKFAYFYWFALIQRCIKLSDGPDDIAKIAYLLEEFFDIRSNHSFEPHKDENQENLLALNEFPDAQNHFKQALSFEAHVRRDSWRLTAGKRRPKQIAYTSPWKTNQQPNFKTTVGQIMTQQPFPNAWSALKLNTKNFIARRFAGRSIYFKKT